VRFFVSIPGQPVSTNHAYKIGQVWIADRSGGQRQIRRPIITNEAVAWRDTVLTLVRLAKPSKWKADGQIRIQMGFFLARDADTDNLKKMILDGIAAALDVNDSRFLTCDTGKESGLALKDAHVDLWISNDPIHEVIMPSRRDPR
jgi:hypothetical protein